MASIKNSLRKIYTALGGSNSKSKTITGLLDDISTVASGGSGGDVFWVTVHFDNNQHQLVADKTYAEIMEKASNKVDCRIWDNYANMSYAIYPIGEVDNYSARFYHTYKTYDEDSGFLVVTTGYIIKNDDTVESIHGAF